MAQIVFVATDDDLQVVWEMILTELRMTAYPDPWFGDLPAPGLKTRADVAANLAQYPSVAPGLGYHLTSPEWSIEPLKHHLCDNNPNFTPHWYVSPRFGGPSIQFIARFGFPSHKKPDEIISGMFSDYPYYSQTKRDFSLPQLFVQKELENLPCFWNNVGENTSSLFQDKEAFE